MSERAYALREGFMTEAQYEDLDAEERAALDAEDGPAFTIYAGGSFAHGPTGRTVDVAELLDATGGTIVTADPSLQQHLEASDAFKNVAKPDGAAAVSVGRDGKVAGLTKGGDGEPEIDPALVPVDPDREKKDDLVALAVEEVEELDAEEAEGLTKADLADRINAARAERREGGEG